MILVTPRVSIDNASRLNGVVLGVGDHQDVATVLGALTNGAGELIVTTKALKLSLCNAAGVHDAVWVNQILT